VLWRSSLALASRTTIPICACDKLLSQFAIAITLGANPAFARIKIATPRIVLLNRFLGQRAPRELGCSARLTLATASITAMSILAINTFLTSLAIADWCFADLAFTLASGTASAVLVVRQLLSKWTSGTSGLCTRCPFA